MREFELTLPDDNGNRLIDEAQSLLAQTGKIPDEYQSLPLPQMFFHCWQWFWELHRARGSNGFGLNPISYLDISAWANLTHKNPSHYDVLAIQLIDSTFLSVYHKQRSKKK